MSISKEEFNEIYLLKKIYKEEQSLNSLHHYEDRGRHQTQLVERLLEIVVRKDLFGKARHELNGLKGSVVSVATDVHANAGQSLLGLEGLNNT